MNVTIAVDDELLARARDLARRQGTSLQELVREQLRSLVGERSGLEVANELQALLTEHGGASGGRAWRRDDAYRDRLG